MLRISGIVLLMFIITTSCSKKPVTPPPPPAPIIGTWSVSKIIDVNTGNDVTATASFGCVAGAVSKFNADGSFSSTDSACSLYVFSGSWTLTADHLVVTANGIGLAWRGTIAFTSDNKNFTLDASSENGYIYTFKKQ